MNSNARKIHRSRQGGGHVDRRNDKGGNMKIIACRFDASLFGKVKVAAKARRVSFATVVCELVEKGLAA